MARTKEEQRAHNNAKQRAYYARKKAQLLQQQTPVGIASNEGQTVLTGAAVDTSALHVDVKVAETPAPKPSLKDRLLGKLGQTSVPQVKKAGPSRKKTTDNLLTTAMPTVVAAFIATYSRNMVKDPYKVCAPTQDECSAILGPLFDILGREVEITGKASQNTIDLINSLICASMYGLRAFMTYTQIKEMETPSHANANQRSGDRTPAPIRPDEHSHSLVASAKAAPTAEDDATRGNADSDNGNSEGGPDEAAIISEMFRRDIAGRQRLGLLRTAV